MIFNTPADDLRELAARLRSLAMVEPRIADQLRQIADAADDRADRMITTRPRRDGALTDLATRSRVVTFASYPVSRVAASLAA
jgi:hypothetical protein